MFLQWPTADKLYIGFRYGVSQFLCTLHGQKHISCVFIIYFINFIINFINQNPYGQLHTINAQPFKVFVLLLTGSGSLLFNQKQQMLLCSNTLNFIDKNSNLTSSNFIQTRQKLNKTKLLVFFSPALV